jgi:hypothetical protein
MFNFGPPRLGCFKVFAKAFDGTCGFRISAWNWANKIMDPMKWRCCFDNQMRFRFNFQMSNKVAMVVAKVNKWNETPTEPEQIKKTCHGSQPQKTNKSIPFFCEQIGFEGLLFITSNGWYTANYCTLPLYHHELVDKSGVENIKDIYSNQQSFIHMFPYCHKPATDNILFKNTVIYRNQQSLTILVGVSGYPIFSCKNKRAKKNTKYYPISFSQYKHGVLT